MITTGLISSVLFLCLLSSAAPVQDNQRLYKRSPVNLKGLAVGALASSAAIGQTDAFNGIPKRPISASAVPGLKRLDQESMFSSPVESTNENVKLFAKDDAIPLPPVPPRAAKFRTPEMTETERALMDGLFMACAIGSATKVKEAIEIGADVNWVNSNGETALMIASYLGLAHVVEILIEHGADVNKANQWRNTPLMLAAKSGGSHIAKLLIENGADLDKKSIVGHSALFIAAFYGNVEVAQVLIEAGADLELKDNNGSTAALAAACMHDLEMIKLLADAGADMGMQNLTGNCPLIASSIAGDVAIVDYLIKHGVPLASEDLNGMNALDHAVKNARIRTSLLLYNNRHKF